ncbi:Crp/Fnr family transcriptional regulator [Bacillaceae bacterium W0354]
MNKDYIRGFLKKFTVFKTLADDEIDTVIDFSVNRTIEKGNHIFLQDDPLTHVYFIHEGRVKIYRTDHNGNEQIVNFLQKGDMFPHQGFFRKATCPAHAEVVEGVVLTCVPIKDFESFLLTNPETCIKLLGVLGDLIVDLQARLEEKILNTIYEQIIKALLRISSKDNQKDENGNVVFKQKITNKEPANMIGSSRETVSRTLTQLKRKELLWTNNDGYICFNFDKLHEEILY